MFRSGRFVWALTGILNRFMSLLVAVLILLMVVKPSLLGLAGGEENRGPLLDFYGQHKFYFVLGAIVLLVLNLNIIQFILYTMWNSQVRRYISSKTTSGTARVSLDALERSLGAAAHGVPEVSRCRLKVYRTGAKRYKVEVHFWIPDEVNVINISEKLRLILKKRFTELVSVEPDDRVFFEISLAGIKGRKRMGPFSAAGPPKDGIDTSGGQFKGPVYPVDGDT